MRVLDREQTDAEWRETDSLTFLPSNSATEFASTTSESFRFRSSPA
jgi:hypothetical protein